MMDAEEPILRGLNMREGNFTEGFPTEICFAGIAPEGHTYHTGPFRPAMFTLSEF